MTTAILLVATVALWAVAIVVLAIVALLLWCWACARLDHWRERRHEAARAARVQRGRSW